jgi:hypothetical protein
MRSPYWSMPRPRSVAAPLRQAEIVSALCHGGRERNLEAKAAQIHAQCDCPSLTCQADEHRSERIR